MAENRVFVGREAQLKQFKEVLHNPKGKAVLVVGQAGMGKSSLIEKMCEEAVGEKGLKCAWVHYEVTETDEPDTTMGLMMDNAFEAACAEERSTDMTDRRKKQWYALIKLIVPKASELEELIKSLRRDVRKNTRDQFVERLRLVSRRMPDKGRVIFVIDSDKYMKSGSADAWRLVVEQLPDKVKFVFGQRPEDELTKNRRFVSLENVVRIPGKKLKELADGEVKDLVSQRADEVGQRREVLDEAVKRYKGHPYMLQAGLDLVKERRTVEGLPDDPTPENIAKDQWKQVKKKGQEAIRLFKAYAILNVGVQGDMVEAVGEVSSDVRESLLAGDFLGGLLDKDIGGNRIYHAILSDHVLSQMSEKEKKQYHRRAAAAYRDKPVVVNPTRWEEIEPLLKAVEHLIAAGEPDAATDVFLTKPSAQSYYTLHEWLWHFGYLDEDIRINGAVIKEYVRLIEREVRRELRSDLAACYDNRALSLRAQGKVAEATADHGRAIEIYRQLFEKEGRRELRNDLAMCYNNRGNARQLVGKLTGAIEDYGRAIGIYKGLVEKEGRRELRNDLAASYNNRGIALEAQGKLKEAIEDYGRAIRIRQELVEKEGRRELRNDLAMCYNNRGIALEAQGKLKEAIEDYGRAIKITEELVEKEGRRELRNNLASRYNNRGGAFRIEGKLTEAMEDHGRAIDIYEELVKKEGRLELRNDLASCYNNRGSAFQLEGKLKESIEDYGRAIGITEELVEKEKRRELRNDLAMCYNNLGSALRAQGKLTEAIADYSLAIGITEELVEREKRRELRNDLAMCYINRGSALADQGKLKEAIEDYGRAIRIRQELVEKEGRRELRNDLASCYNNRGIALEAQGKLKEAIEDYGRAIKITEELVEKEGRRELRNNLASRYNNRGGAFQLEGKLTEAIEDYGRAIGIREVLVEKEGRRELRNDLAMCYNNRGIAQGLEGKWGKAREDIEKGGGLLIELIKEGQRQVISSFLKTAGYRCAFAEELGGVNGAAEWANEAMRWVVEEADPRRRGDKGERMNEVLLKAAAGFIEIVRGNAKVLIKGGLDEKLLERIVDVLTK